MKVRQIKAVVCCIIFYSAERLENKAVEILQKYKNGELLLSPQAMDVDRFAEFHLKAKIDFANLSQDRLTLGCTCFNDGVLMVWDDERTEEVPLNVERGWILVDNDILDCEVEGRIRFTIIHECAHWILHPRFYYQKPGEKIPRIQCTIFQIEDKERRLPMTDEEVREWQADRLGAALIMPANTVKMLLAGKLGLSDVNTLGVSLDPFTDNHHSAAVLGKAKFLNPASWRCAMIWCAVMGLPLSLENVGAALGLEKQKLTEGKDLIRYFCKPQGSRELHSDFRHSSSRLIVGHFKTKKGTVRL